VLFGLMAPFAAALINRFGMRRITLTALLIIATALLSSLAMTRLWQLIMLWGVLLGLGTGLTALVLGVTVATRWFSARRGLVIGLLTASTSTGQLVFLPTMASLVTLFGWRLMSLALAGTAMMFVPLVAMLMRDRPEDVGLAPYGEVGKARTAASPAGNPLTAAFRTLAAGARSRDFRLIAGSYFICGASTNGLISTHLIPACVDHGLTEVSGAGLLAVTGAFSFIGGTLSGWLSDRWDNRLLLAWYYGLRGLSLLYLPFAFDMSFYGLSLFSVFYGLDWIASVPPTVRLLTGVVGTERAGIMVAWITVIHQVGGALAAYLGGVLRISLGTYFEAFLLAGLFCFAAALMALLIGTGRRGAEPAGEAVPAG